ncbi:MAG: NUDIX hydrolase [Ardenticatenaceae bacterium]
MVRSLLYDLLLPLWQRAPLGLRRWLIWQGTSKFVVGVAAVCLNPRNEMLLLEHRFHNEYPWGFPGGWTDRGEAPIEALMREVREETGLEPTVTDLLCVAGDGEWVEIYYLCHVPEGELVIQPTEAIGYRWVNPLTCTLPLTANQARVLKIVVAYLEGHPSPIFPVSAADL